MAEILWVIVALGASALWGMVYVLDKKILETFTVLEMMALSCTFSMLSCWLGVFLTTGVRGTWQKMAVPENFKWMAATILCAFIANLLILKSIQLSNATLAALVEISYPLFTVLFSCWLLRVNTLTWDVAIGATLILSGVLWISLRAAP